MLSGIAYLGFERPAALWILAALAPIILLYFLRMRFRRRSIGSTFLWRGLAEATSGGDALRRRSLLLLLLQAAAISLAAFAAAGPSLVSRRTLEPGTAFLIDVSASMGSRDCPGPRGPRTANRVEAAVEAASREIDALGDGVPIMTFACSSSATALLPSPTLDKGAAKASLRALRPGSGSLAEGACADALSAWLARSDGAWRARAFTDGALDLGGARLASAFAGAFGAEVLGTGGDSVGVTGLRLSALPDGRLRAAFTLWNGHAKSEELRLLLRRGKQTLADGSAQALPGWSRSSLDFAGKLEDGGYELELERGAGEIEGAPGQIDYLSVAARPALSILLVGRGDPFLKAALARSDISYSSLAEFPSQSAAKAGAATGASPDIVVAEGVPIPSDFRGNLLVFGAPPSGAPIVAKGPIAGPIASAERGHPLARFLSWEGAQASAGLCYSLRGPAIVLATTGGQPSIVAWEKDGYRSLACGIDLARSDLGLKGAFPVLLQNYLQWCAPRADDQSAYTLTVGESARRLEPPSFSVGGGDIELLRSGPAVSLSARSSGLFDWEADGRRGYIAANAPSGELDVAPRPLGPLADGAAHDGGLGVAGALAAVERESRLPLGAPACAILLACLAAEWMLWRGRSRRRGGVA